MKNEKIGSVIAGLLCLASVVYADPSGIGFGAGQSMNPFDALSEARARNIPDAPRTILAGDTTDNDLSADKTSRAVEWVSINGGKFMMGSNDKAELFADAKPVHAVTIESFEMSKTPVTVEQYAECVAQGACTEPDTYNDCNWGKPGLHHHPINCVDWEQANQFARFKGARLPTEAEWEYAATSAGKKRKYPWGNEAASCKRAVMYGIDEKTGRTGAGCGNDNTMPVCSKPAGNAKVSGGELCDIVGNVAQWLQDKYEDSYDGAPIDGSAVDNAGSARVIRGGSWNVDSRHLRSAYRFSDTSSNRWNDVGIRLARSIR